MVFATGSGVFSVTNSSFEGNSAKRGGVAHLQSNSKFVARNSSFDANQASRNSYGDLTYLSSSSTFELSNANLRDHDNIVLCDGTATVYAAQLTDMNLTEGLFTLDGNCVLFLYFTNQDGSPEYGQILTERNVAFGGTANLVQWNYPVLKSNTHLAQRNTNHYCYKATDF